MCKGRAVDNQLYVAVVSPARDETAEYIVWAHSTCVNPYGDILSKDGHEQEITYAEIGIIEILYFSEKAKWTHNQIF